MTDLTLPGIIPELLRRGSPCTHDDGSGRLVVLTPADQLPARMVDVADAVNGDVVAFSAAHLALDLTDATGRCHAAWWLLNEAENVTVSCGVTQEEAQALLFMAMYGKPMSDDDVRALRLVCLHVAGVRVE